MAKSYKFTSILKKEAGRKIMEMDIHTDNLGYVYYHQILFHVMKYHTLQNLQHNAITKPQGDEIID